MTQCSSVPLEQIEEVLDREVRPKLALHGGNIRSLDCRDGLYRFQLTGQCAGCPSAGFVSSCFLSFDSAMPLRRLYFCFVSSISGRLPMA